MGAFSLIVVINLLNSFMDGLDDDLPDLDALLDQAELALEENKAQTVNRQPSSFSFDPLNSAGDFGHLTGQEPTQLSNVELIGLFLGNQQSASDEQKNEVTASGNSTEEESLPTPPEERHDEENEQSGTFNINLEERTPSRENISSAHAVDVQEFEHSEAENVLLPCESACQMSTQISETTVSSQPSNLIPQFVGFYQPDVSEVEFEQYMSEMENEIEINSFSSSNRSEQAPTSLTIETAESANNIDWEVNPETQSIQASYIDDSPLAIMQELVQPQVLPDSEIEPIQLESTQEASDPAAVLNSESEANPAKISGNHSYADSTLLEQIQKQTTDNDRKRDELAAPDGRPLRPLVEYFGGNSPEGSLNSEELSAHALVPSNFTKEHSISQLGSIEPRWVEDKHRLVCSNCESKFNLVNRRHHCRACGEVFCAKCSDGKRVLAFNTSAGPQRVCRSCNDVLLMQEETQKKANREQRSQRNSPNSPYAPSAPPAPNSAEGSPPSASTRIPPHKPPTVSHRDPRQYCSQGDVSSAVPTHEQQQRPNNWVVYIPSDLINGNQENLSSTPEGTPVDERPHLKSALKHRNTTPGRSGFGNSYAVGGGGGSASSNHSEASKYRVCFADGVSPGAACIEDPPTSRYDIIRKTVSRGARALTRQQQLMNRQQQQQQQQRQAFDSEGNLLEGFESDEDCQDELEIVETRPGAIVRRKIRETLLGSLYDSVNPMGVAQPLPPVVCSEDDNFAKELKLFKDETQRSCLITHRCENASKPPVRFKLETNLHVNVKICDLSCCLNGECFVFISDGLEHHCQTEVVFILRRQSPDETIPTSAFDLFSHIYRMALLGITYKSLDCMSLEFLPDFLGQQKESNDAEDSFEDDDASPNPISSVLFFTQTCQCDQRLPLPPDRESRSPLLFAMLLHKWEASWAKVYPLRVLLRIGHAFKQYPCPLVSVRDRQPLFCQLTGSIMDQFVDLNHWDFNDFKVLPDSFAHITTSDTSSASQSEGDRRDEKEDEESSRGQYSKSNSATFLIPRNRYNAVNEVLLSSEEMEDEMLFGLSLSSFADSHLVCVETTSPATAAEEDHHTKFEPQAFGKNRDGTRRCTGVGFLLFSGTLHPDIEEENGQNSSTTSTTVPDNEPELQNSAAPQAGCKSAKGVTARITIVEDGLVVLMCRTIFAQLKLALAGMKDFQIPCQTISDYKDDKSCEQSLSVRWIDDYEVHSPSEISPIDGSDLETFVSCNVFNAFDYVCRPAKGANASAATSLATSNPNSLSSHSGVDGETVGELTMEKLSLHDSERSEVGAVGGMDMCKRDEASAMVMECVQNSGNNGSGVFRWTRVFYLNPNDAGGGTGVGGSSGSGREEPSEPLVDEPNDTDRLPQKLAKAFCLAMSAHIALLRSLNYHKLALRVHISVENVEYKAGSNGTQFTTTTSDATSAICDSMDTHLVPVVFEEAARVQSTAPIAMELHFFLLDIPPQPPVTTE